ncbi:23S rRNA (guanosine(2251)-2'-O)-methyltransferase RlmB [Desertimonas flava]|uniref:23S rRNA (guanosine(2251)-2'-O)-methyltransferase RlmB n=1 Tax=Desertimonas flava TaxID=2064846 RepID=UPI000E3484E2|nr:23S rRNA (guanosine(2251)-2'-O)-methyltransferase RlmB [Desertimonas flava]
MSPRQQRSGSGRGGGNSRSGQGRGSGKGSPRGQGRAPAKPGRSGAKPGRPAAKSARGSTRGSRVDAPAANANQGVARPPRTRLVPSRATQTHIGVDRSRGAARVGGVRRLSGDPLPKRSEKGLGGEQVEGRQAVRELLIAGRRRIHEIWLSAELFDDEAVADILEIAKANRVPVASVARNKLDARARTEAPQGIIAYAAPLEEGDLGALIRGKNGKPPFLVAVDGVTDPGNLGAILRNCEGAGVDGVILPSHRAVHVTPTVTKSAAGAVEYVPLVLVGGLPTAINQLRQHKVWVVGLDDAADRSLFDIADLAVEGICLVLGAEGAGLSRLVRERCDMIVSIPMLGRLSSLNVSAAAALATYEVARHRA